MTIAKGEVIKDRYHSFLKLMKESEYHEMSYFEKREKDRQLGKFIKSVVKKGRTKW